MLRNFARRAVGIPAARSTTGRFHRQLFHAAAAPPPPPPPSPPPLASPEALRSVELDNEGSTTVKSSQQYATLADIATLGLEGEALEIVTCLCRDDPRLPSVVYLYDDLYDQI